MVSVKCQFFNVPCSNVKMSASTQISVLLINVYFIYVTKCGFYVTNRLKQVRYVKNSTNDIDVGCYL